MVSVILTTYKRELAVLQRALQSVMNQTYKDIEIIIVNDNPENDDNDLYISRFASENSKFCSIKYIHLEENMGACKARNRGVEFARGEYVAFIDDDDEWISYKLEKQVDAIQKSGDCVLVTGYVLLDNGCIYNQGMEYEGNVEKELLKRNFIGGASIPLMRKSAFNRAGGFDARYPSSQDYNMWLKIAKEGKISFLKEVLVEYHLSDDSITNNIKKRVDGWRLILEDFQDDYKNYPGSYHVFVYIMCEQLRNTSIGYRAVCIKYLIRDLLINGISKEWIVSLLRSLRMWK